ncbi:MAG: hypothetical protein WCJ61_00125 [Paludibacter sp.]
MSKLHFKIITHLAINFITGSSYSPSEVSEYSILGGISSYTFLLTTAFASSSGFSNN